ncbi:hypothetical protein AcV7_009529 [Taiwanofungus camphoratus]|nr:hypothetical protein AcV7_009529 [Antrodia cinnamomea]
MVTAVRVSTRPRDQSAEASQDCRERRQRKEETDWVSTEMEYLRTSRQPVRVSERQKTPPAESRTQKAGLRKSKTPEARFENHSDGR